LAAPFLLQQLKVASFLGVIATGMMVVILLGQIGPLGALGGGGRR
jgi:ribose transport system permease protein